jgi:beta-1,4-galactosyltransferase 1
VKRLKDTPQWPELDRTIGASLTPGGRHRPSSCAARQKVAIVIPFRDRAEHLRILLSYLHTVLQSQQLDYGVYVMEQTGLPVTLN